MAELGGEARYRVIARELRNDIESGRLKPGQRLPSTRELASQWKVSISAINDAMQLLEREGLVITRPRSGRIVADSTSAGRGSRNRPDRPHVVFVGGYAGSGKTEFGRTLARLTGWAMLDKDTLTRTVVDTALVELGSSISDRESDLYLSKVRPAEYDCLNAAVLENAGCGVSVIATAPFAREFAAETWFRQQAAKLHELGVDMSVVWIRCSADTMRSYIDRRAALRDSWKLKNWEKYVDGLDLSFEPPWPHTIVTNEPDSLPLREQAENVLKSISGG